MGDTTTAGPSIVSNTMLPLSVQATLTLQTMARGGELRPSAFCHEDQSEVRGWMLDFSADANATVLTVPHNLFHGVSMVQCELSESEALALMQNAEATRQCIAQALRELREEAAGENTHATWRRCRPRLDGVPTSLHTATRDRDGKVVFCANEAHPAILDGARWVPELSPDGFVGLYFQWADARLEVFAICQSYLPQACADFADMVHRAGGGCSVGFVCLSEEAQWLRSACARNRARILARVCAQLSLRIPLMTDYCGAAPADALALVCAETLHHDIALTRGGTISKVRQYNYCCAETSGGSLCGMAPWEGVWLFRGASDSARCGWVYPTTTPRVRERARAFAFVTRPRVCPTVLRVDDTRTTHGEDDEADDVGALLSRLAKTPMASTHTIVEGGEDPNTTVIDQPMIRAAYKRAVERNQQCALVDRAILVAAQRGDGVASHCCYYYLTFDETVLQRMAGMGWSRSRGICKLMPLGVVQWSAPPADKTI